MPECVLDIPCDEGQGVYLRNDSLVAGKLQGRMDGQCQWKKLPSGIHVIRMPIIYPTPYVRVEHYTALNQIFSANKITLEAWICLDQLPSEMDLDEDERISPIISKRNNSLSTGWAMVINKYNMLNCELRGLTPSTIEKFNMTTLQTKQWYHCAITWDGAADAIIRSYLNGEMETSQATPGNLTLNEGWLGFGKHGVQTFKGLLSRVRVYDYALTAETIFTHHRDEVADYGWPELILSDMRDMVREVLNDYDVPYTVTDKVMDRALSQVVSDFSQLHPYELVTRLPVGADEPIVSLDRLEERIDILKVEYPIGNLPPTYAEFVVSADELRLKGFSAWASMAAAYPYCNVHWTKRHDLEDAYTTIPDIYLDAIALGAAGHLVARSNLAEANETWRRWANNAISQFNRSIGKHSERRRIVVRHLETGELT